MFSLDRWREILDTLWRNKLRTTLTALSMAWGIFMLVVLLGLGNGLQVGAEKGFQDDATNSVWMFGGQTSKPAKGLPIGRRIVMANRDVDAVDALDKVDHITGRFFMSGGHFRGELAVRAADKVSSFDVRAVHPGHLYLEKTIVVAGRYLNDRDIEARRKVAVIGIPVATFLFGTPDVIGRWIEINRVSFQVIGVFDDEGGEGEQKKIYVPITTAQAAFNGADRVNQLMFTVGDASVEEAKRITDEAIALLAEAHDFDPDDPQAVRVRNNVENFENFRKIFLMLDVFVTLMAGCAILAGVVGVSNIMLIVVRERTKEIGIRKALGATPLEIVGSIVQEAVFLTSVAGYFGLVAGVGLLTLIEELAPPNEMFGAPQVDLGVAVFATAILVVAGALAGFFPARQAAKVNPIVALRDE
jgi:putative ABC transport system permease protein